MNDPAYFFNPLSVYLRPEAGASKCICEHLYHVSTVTVETQAGRVTKLMGQMTKEQEPFLLAEQRPDGRWYASRDWDAHGYANFSITSLAPSI